MRISRVLEDTPNDEIDTYSRLDSKTSRQIQTTRAVSMERTSSGAAGTPGKQGNAQDPQLESGSTKQDVTKGQANSHESQKPAVGQQQYGQKHSFEEDEEPEKLGAWGRRAANVHAKKGTSGQERELLPDYLVNK
ncbi:Uu.00g059780.m01.CDS01 [Anthostomella pinea]|uniref:Uu.00g059780.m01.CDS01 n=1 Tax=Anthostomella pinea TaxID=933095 RepID=A0AAI8VSZ0_9PEZI|nr:Uu.00g059780.m01.CDS01 [Anthostomella pinea]